MARGETKTNVKKVSVSGATKKRAQSVPKSSCPKYTDMVTQALLELHDRKGSSRQAISKWIKANFSVGEHAFAHCLKTALSKLLEEEKIVQVKGSFKLAAELRAQLKPGAHKPESVTETAQPSKRAGTKRKSAPVKSSPAAKRAKTSSAKRSTKKAALQALQSKESDQMLQEESEGRDKVAAQERVSPPLAETHERPSESEAFLKDDTMYEETEELIGEYAEANASKRSDKSPLREGLESEPEVGREEGTQAQNKVHHERASAEEAVETSVGAEKAQEAKQSKMFAPQQVTESNIESQEQSTAEKLDASLAENVNQAEVEQSMNAQVEASATAAALAQEAESQPEQSAAVPSEKHAEPTVQEHEISATANEEKQRETNASLHIEEQTPGDLEEGTPVVNNAIVMEPQDESRSASPSERSGSVPEQSMQ